MGGGTEGGMRQAQPVAANMDVSELSMCAGKDRFGSYALAAQVASRMNRRGASRRLMPYRCLHCGGHHVGNNNE